MAKTECPISRHEFHASAPALTVAIGDRTWTAQPREFKTGSLGWNVGDKVPLIPTGTAYRDFVAKARQLRITIGDRTVVADPRTFSTGTLGWYANDKITVLVDGIPVRVQVGIGLYVVGSKEQGGADILDLRVQVGVNLTVVGSKDLPA